MILSLIVCVLSLNRPHSYVKVSHQLGLPPQSDSVLVEKLRDQFRKATAENRALKEKLDDKLEEIRCTVATFPTLHPNCTPIAM